MIEGKQMIIKVAWGKYIGLICILLLGMFSSPASAELVNIVSNSGFESGITQWDSIPMAEAHS